MTTIDLIDGFYRQSIIGIDPIVVFLTIGAQLCLLYSIFPVHGGSYITHGIFISDNGLPHQIGTPTSHSEFSHHMGYFLIRQWIITSLSGFSRLTMSSRITQWILTSHRGFSHQTMGSHITYWMRTSQNELLPHTEDSYIALVAPQITQWDITSHRKL